MENEAEWSQLNTVIKEVCCREKNCSFWGNRRAAEIQIFKLKSTHMDGVFESSPWWFVQWRPMGLILKNSSLSTPTHGPWGLPKKHREKPKKAPYPALQWSEMLHAYGKAFPWQLWDHSSLLTHTLQAPSCPPESREPCREPLPLGKRPGAEIVLQNFWGHLK